jgi:hypothetical protein
MNIKPVNIYYLLKIDIITFFLFVKGYLKIIYINQLSRFFDTMRKIYVFTRWFFFSREIKYSVFDFCVK